ncbi:MAG: MBL fold metallo-hydrolase [Spirochaetes bacterium]|nr:MBL fold metallo-hydrolase [Spirochaetota bacterium]
MALKFKVFLHSYLGFNSNSTLFYGEKDAILIDASQMLSDSYRLISKILPMRKRLTHIYISHFHPDHHFGLAALKFAFPDAKIVALPSVVKDIVFTSNDKVDMWAIDRFGPGEIPKSTTIPMPLSEPKLELEGEEIIVSDGWEGDSINNSVVWVSSIGVACATDVAFHDCHLWPVESNVSRRVLWRKDIARLKDFGARILIPGHCDEEKIQIMEDVQEDMTRTYIDCVDWSIQYLDNYDEVYSTAKSAEEMVNRIYERYPGMKPADVGIQWQARLLYPHSSPDWLLPLPGPPGKIFLNPAGKYDGDPPRE